MSATRRGGADFARFLAKRPQTLGDTSRVGSGAPGSEWPDARAPLHGPVGAAVARGLRAARLAPGRILPGASTTPSTRTSSASSRPARRGPAHSLHPAAPLPSLTACCAQQVKHAFAAWHDGKVLPGCKNYAKEPGEKWATFKAPLPELEHAFGFMDGAIVQYQNREAIHGTSRSFSRGGRGTLDPAFLTRAQREDAAVTCILRPQRTERMPRSLAAGGQSSGGQRGGGGGGALEGRVATFRVVDDWLSRLLLASNPSCDRFGDSSRNPTLATAE